MSKQCPDCRSQVDDPVKKCPQCGYSFAKAQKKSFRLKIAAGIVSAAAIVGAGGAVIHDRLSRIALVYGPPATAQPTALPTETPEAIISPADATPQAAETPLVTLPPDDRDAYEDIECVYGPPDDDW